MTRGQAQSGVDLSQRVEDLSSAVASLTEDREQQLQRDRTIQESLAALQASVSALQPSHSASPIASPVEAGVSGGAPYPRPELADPSSPAPQQQRSQQTSRFDRDFPHWSSVYPSQFDRVPAVAPDHLPFASGVFHCVDGRERSSLRFPVVACAHELDNSSPYALGRHAVAGVPRPSPVQLADSRNAQAHQRLLEVSKPKAVELQFLGSAVAWQHATLRGLHALLANHECLSFRELLSQLELAADAFELNLASQIGRLKYLALPGDDHLGGPAVRDGIVTQVGARQLAALSSPLITAPVDVDEVALGVAADLSSEHAKQLTKLHVRDSLAKARQ